MIDKIPRTNLRRRNAESLAIALMNEVSDLLPDVDRDAVYERLFQVLHDNGAAWITDAERAARGMEPRDELGWTPSLKALRDEIESLNRVAAIVIHQDSKEQS